MKKKSQVATLNAKTKESTTLSTKKEEAAILKAKNGIEGKIKTFISSSNNKNSAIATEQLGNGWIMEMVYRNHIGNGFTEVLIFHDSWENLKIGEIVGETYNIRELSHTIASYVVTCSKPTVAKRVETELEHERNRITSKTIKIKGLF